MILYQFFTFPLRKTVQFTQVLVSADKSFLKDHFNIIGLSNNNSTTVQHKFSLLICNRQDHTDTVFLFLFFF